MAKNRKPSLKDNLGKGKKKDWVRIIFFIVILVIAGYEYFQKTGSGSERLEFEQNIGTKDYDYLPSSKGEIVHHTFYSLSYLEKYEQPEWVAYVLTKKQLLQPRVGRTDVFVPDPKVSTYSAVSDDYRGSGYTRGHLVPAGDMGFDSTAMRETFFMSNMSPQLRQLNNGIWRELEETVRDWAFKYGELYIVSGPVLNKPIKTIGRRNKVAVPEAFYKALLINTPGKKSAVGFVIPHELSERPLKEYMVSVREVEELTGIDFFADLLTDKEEEKFETSYDAGIWPFSEKRYQLRVKNWNYQ